MSIANLETIRFRLPLAAQKRKEKPVSYETGFSLVSKLLC